MDKTKIIERCNRNLSRQNAALKGTLDELDMLEQLEKAQPGSYGPALTQLRTKRDRQAANVKMTENYITAVKASKK